MAIKSVTILGNSVFADILGGREPNHSDAAHENADAQIGSVKIGGSFIGSSIAAGVNPGAGGFGIGATVISGGSSSIESAIASIVIGGQAIGKSASDGSGVAYGIVAQDIGSIKVGSASVSLKAGADNDTTPIPIGISGDLFIYEL